MENINYPLVSIGVPVFNGENGLAKALSALLNQDYQNLEIIISDNASTDSTKKICNEFLIKYKNIRYYRNEKNLGSVDNFNKLVQLAMGKYFMWAAHDDLREKNYVSSCVEKLEKASDSAVLCQSYTKTFIQGSDDILCINTLDSFEGVIGPINQYRETLKHFPATAIYGLYRLSAMRKTKLFQKTIATDLAFIQELSAYGQFIQVKKPLFTYIGRKNWNNIQQDYKVFFGDRKKPWWYVPFIALFFNNLFRIKDLALPFSCRLKMVNSLVFFEIRRIFIRVIIKMIPLLFSKGFKDMLGDRIYWKYLHNPNIIVFSHDLFEKRVIIPSLRWNN